MTDMELDAEPGATMAKDESSTFEAEQLAEQVYTRYAGHYERHHPGVALLPWRALDAEVQRRWSLALTPTASALEEARRQEESLSALRQRAQDLRAENEFLRAHCRSIDELRAELAEAITLGQMTPKLALILTKLVEVGDDRG